MERVRAIQQLAERIRQQLATTAAGMGPRPRAQNTPKVAVAQVLLLSLGQRHIHTHEHSSLCHTGCWCCPVLSSTTPLTCVWPQSSPHASCNGAGMPAADAPHCATGSAHSGNTSVTRCMWHHTGTPAQPTNSSDPLLSEPGPIEARLPCRQPCYIPTHTHTHHPPP